jgi:hypothetical protein
LPLILQVTSILWPSVHKGLIPQQDEELNVSWYRKKMVGTPSPANSTIWQHLNEKNQCEWGSTLCYKCVYIPYKCAWWPFLGLTPWVHVMLMGILFVLECDSHEIWTHGRCKNEWLKVSFTSIPNNSRKNRIMFQGVKFGTIWCKMMYKHVSSLVNFLLLHFWNLVVLPWSFINLSCWST